MVSRYVFPRDEQAPSRARQAVAGLDPPVDGLPWADVTLLVSELVTNSVVYGNGENVVLLIDDKRPEHLRCEVVDGGSGFVPTARGDRAVGGWGLELVEKLTSSWGVREGSTHVWFELRPDAIGTS
ncbi:MAG TPA: ATP-binding protein [Solirubrobacteraceae bacterium]|nr:ATP-binding protein [Solirubrobacteraceae bacterium]